MLIYKGNTSAPMMYQNGVPIWDFKRHEEVYYMMSDGNEVFEPIMSINSTNVVIEFDLVPGNYTGDIYVGAVRKNDEWYFETSMRWFAVNDNWVLFDAGNGRTDTNIYIDLTHKYHVVTSKIGDQCSCVVTDLDTGVVVWSPSYENGNYVNNDLEVRSGYDTKLYNLKVTIDNNVVIDAVATANGLYNSVSHSIIPLNHFTPVKEG